MSADPLEGSERARQEFEKWGNAKGAHVEQSWNGEFYENKLVESAWQGWQARGRSLEQERDELRILVGLKDDLLRAYRTGDHKLDDRTLAKLEKYRG